MLLRHNVFVVCLLFDALLSKCYAIDHVSLIPLWRVLHSVHPVWLPLNPPTWDCSVIHCPHISHQPCLCIDPLLVEMLFQVSMVQVAISWGHRGFTIQSSALLHLGRVRTLTIRNICCRCSSYSTLSEGKYSRRCACKLLQVISVHLMSLPPFGVTCIHPPVPAPTFFYTIVVYLTLGIPSA